MTGTDPGTEAYYFREQQRFTQWWLWTLFAVVTLGVAVVLLLDFREATGVTPLGVVIAVYVLALVFGIFGLLFWMRLTVEVRDDGIHVRFPPFVRRIIAYDELAAYEPRTYRPIREFGGWGLRWGLGGQAYNVKGNRGLQLVFTNGKRLLIGSQRPEEFAAAIDLAAGSRTR